MLPCITARKTRSLYITRHAQKLTTVVQLFLFIIITVRYSLNHHVKIIDALAANRPHQPTRHLVTAATTAAVATAAGQITSKSLAGGSKSQGNPREGKDLAGPEALISEADMVRALPEQLMEI